MTGRASIKSVVEEAALAWLDAFGYSIAHTEIAPGELAAERMVLEVIW